MGFRHESQPLVRARSGERRVKVVLTALVGTAATLALLTTSGTTAGVTQKAFFGSFVAGLTSFFTPTATTSTGLPAVTSVGSTTGPVEGSTAVSQETFDMCMEHYPLSHGSKPSFQCQQNKIDFSGNSGIKKCLVVGDGVTFGKGDGSGYTPPLAKKLRESGTCDVYHIGQIAPSPNIDDCTSAKDEGCNIENIHDICHGFQCISMFTSPKCNGGSCLLMENDPALEDGWDLIIYNFGIHDIMKRGWAGDQWDPPLTDAQIEDPKNKLTSFVPKEAYGEMLKNVTAKLAQHSKNVMFVTTTPLPTDFCAPGQGCEKKSFLGLTNDDVNGYNDIARTALSQLQTEGIANVGIADLNKMITDHCEPEAGAGWTNNGNTACEWQANPPHFKDHYGPIADFIAENVGQALGGEASVQPLGDAEGGTHVEPTSANSTEAKTSANSTGAKQ
eukprot:SAG11_NODE_113_length_16061_cov_16.161143_1_plen_445_part_00